MEIFWANARFFALPSTQRADVIVHDGAFDLRLWRGPGVDRDFERQYGDNLQDVLNRQTSQLEGGLLAAGQVVRMHPGKLRCNYLLWIGTRGVEREGRQSAAPSLDVVEQAVVSALEFARERESGTVAFGPLGAGPDASPDAERLAAVVKAAHRFQDRCFEQHEGTGVETVLVCHPSSAVTAVARQMVGRLARSAPVRSPQIVDPVEKKVTRRRSTGTRSSSGPRSATSGRRRASESLDPIEVAKHRNTAPSYDRTQTYVAGDWFSHPHFGIGQVSRVTPEGAIQVLFESGANKKMLHAR